jgi:protein-disulfide isomerase
MYKFWSAALLLALFAACEKPSKLDSVTQPAASIPHGDLEARVARLEKMLATREPALAMLDTFYERQRAQIEEQEASDPAPGAMFAIDIASDVAGGQVEGSPSAPVTIVKAFDFACPYCQKLNETLEKVVAKNPDKVRVVYKSFLIHEPALPAHLAGCAAGKQGKYAAFKNAFWEKGYTPYAESRGEKAESMGPENILKIAGELGLDTKRFEDDMKSEACKTLVKGDVEELGKWKVHATPTVYVNGVHTDPMDEDGFQKLIDEKAKEVASSGVASADYYQKVVFEKGEKKFRSKKDPVPN